MPSPSALAAAAVLESESAMNVDSDPASSLRAAALLTLKSKRRKPASSLSNPGLPPKPPGPSESMPLLDYGQEEFPPTQKASAEDAEMEEGEIDDSEIIAISKTASSKRLSAEPALPPERAPTKSPSPVILKRESPPNLLERLAASPVTPTPSTMAGIESTPELNNLLTDENHVRPGLALTRAQYETCKDIILDLLGWGVPPEYLTVCGLSRQVIFYVFTELNLRLPLNFDRTGLVPHVPKPTDADSMPPPPVPVSPTHLRHALPPRPPAITTAPIGQVSPDAIALQDMERQRREELLARKRAVQATRKKLQPPTSPGASSIASSRYSPERAIQDVDMMSAQSESVDDFLKTIHPHEHSRLESDHPMDVDEIPGLDTAEPTPPPDVVPLRSPTLGQVTTPSSPLATTPQDRPTFVDYQGPQRRRPTAADFVDMEATKHNGPTERRVPRTLQRKKNGSFAGVGKVRRLVIDLSDSDGETDGDYQMVDPSEDSSSSSTPNISDKYPRTQSPAVLAEKEREIARIRQLIAEKELIKLNRSQNQDSIATPIDTQRDTDTAHVAGPSSTCTSPSILQSMTPSITSVTSTANIDSIRLDGAISMTFLPGGSGSLTPDDQAEFAVLPEAPQIPVEAVDVDHRTSSSTQPVNIHEVAGNPAGAEGFSMYESPFQSYPLLRSRPAVYPSEVVQDSASTDPMSEVQAMGSLVSPSTTLPSRSFPSASVQTNSLATYITPDLRPLKLAVASRALDPSKVICQYEIPGGGVCRDEGCQDIHPSRLQAVDGGLLPTEDETASYLHLIMDVDIRKTASALQQVRADHPGLKFEECVARALQISIQPT